MVVHLIARLGAEDLEHLLHDDVAPGVGVLPGELHRRHVFLPAPIVQRQQLGRAVHRAVAEVAARRLVAEPATPEVDSDPHPVILVAKQVHVVVAAPDGPELLGGEVQHRR